MPVMRLQRALARAGIASRRKAEALITEGRVSVNGVVAELGQSVDTDSDKITVEGATVTRAAAHTWLALNKPAGVITAASDPRGRKTVFDLLTRVPPGLTYVGRLDYLTEGLLLLTTDGDAVNLLTHPSSGVERVYQVLVKGRGGDAAALLGKGVELDKVLTIPTAVTAARVARGRWKLEITLREGKNREVRRLCESVDVEVEQLVRTRFGPVSLSQLPTGASRSLTRGEVAAIGRLMRSAGRLRKK